VGTPEVFVYPPTAQVVAAPGVVVTEYSWLELPGCGLGTVAQDVPLPNRVHGALPLHQQITRSLTPFLIAVAYLTIWS